MKRVHLLIPTLLVIGLAAGCTVRGGFRVRSTAPSMVLVSPGVYVVEDHSEPVFYSEGSYWRYHGGVWYSSRVHTGGWVRVRTVPGHVRRIDRPHTYVHYRGSARGNVRGNARPAARDHRRVEHRDNRGGNARPAVRDHRTPAPAVRVRGQTNNAGGVRVKTDTKVKVKVKTKTRVRGETNSPGRVKVRDSRR